MSVLGAFPEAVEAGNAGHVYDHEKIAWLLNDLHECGICHGLVLAPHVEDHRRLHIGTACGRRR